MKIPNSRFFKVTYHDGSASIFEKIENDEFRLRIICHTNDTPDVFEKSNVVWTTDQFHIIVGSYNQDMMPKFARVTKQQMFIYSL